MKVATITSAVVKPEATLTSNNTTMSDGDTVTIGNKTYTFKTALTPTEGQVLINGSADAGLLNLIRAINHTGTPDTDYKCAAAHTQVSADASVTSHSITVRSLTSGVGDAAYAVTKSAATLTWGTDTYLVSKSFTVAGTLATGTAAQPSQQVTIANYPTDYGLFTRVMRLTDTQMQVRRFGSGGLDFALLNTSLVTLAVETDPLLTYAPIVLSNPEDDSCVASSTAATFTTDFTSELAITIVWQYESKATNTLTSDNTEIADGDTVTVNGRAYRFKDTMAAAYDVKRHGTTADTTLANLIAAINASGTAGVEYYTGTLVHPTVQADPSVAAHVVTLRARLSGTEGNAYTLAESTSHITIGNALFSGGGTWASATGTILDCTYSGEATETLTATPTSTRMSGTQHRCVGTNTRGSATSDEATLTITAS